MTDITKTIEEVNAVRSEIEDLRAKINCKKTILKDLEDSVSQQRNDFRHAAKHEFRDEDFIRLFEDVKLDRHFLQEVMDYLESNLGDDEFGYACNVRRSYNFLYDQGIRTSKDLFLETIKDEKIFTELEKLKSERDALNLKINKIDVSIDERFKKSLERSDD